MKVKKEENLVTRTTNQLHFEDLDPIRFEELILAMAYKWRRWESINHFGKLGSDDGIDIEATENLYDRERMYIFQCKRYIKISQSQLKKIVDEFLSKNNVFVGTLNINDNIPTEDLKFILACLFHLDKIGGMKSRGIGKVRVKINGDYLEGEKDVKSTKPLDKIVSELKRENHKVSTDLKNDNFLKYSYTIELKEPIVLKSRELGNYVETRTSIQGSTIRGALIEYFSKKGYNLNILKNIEASDATKENNKIRNRTRGTIEKASGNSKDGFYTISTIST